MLTPKKNEEFLKILLKRKESQTIDFKQLIKSPQKIAKTLVAFANTEGGIIVIGVSDNKKIIGIDPEEEIFMVEKAISENCTPPPIIHFELFETLGMDEKNIEIEKSVLLVHVQKSTQKHFFKNENGELLYYKRLDDHTLPYFE
ncbi:ATP-binding protein [Aquiflexum sp. TKW24L]|uniref:AlbA family DNA-binding domain-containing protein n=1 Tax=Aquiflexum sp. TKW24L TaxID=2942212 RepID=UPI0020C1897E|nr:ATP-binding protein [Aquiflexum sp. TKW24L]MCL6259876.1 ATP-binding protein [Aquiflexum sp. TKW24L]